MPECKICADKVDEITECKKCGILFCDNCGNTVEMICEYCQEEEEW